MSSFAYVLRGRSRLRLPAAWRQPLAIAGAVIAFAWIVIAIFAPLIAPDGPLAQSFPASTGPSLHHLFGTDELGRDVLSRVVYGTRVSIPIALGLVALAATIGGTVGAIAGYFRGIADGVLMRAADLVFAFPPIILAMVVSAVLGRGLRNAALAIVCRASVLIENVFYVILELRFSYLLRIRDRRPSLFLASEPPEILPQQIVCSADFAQLVVCRIADEVDILLNRFDCGLETIRCGISLAKVEIGRWFLGP